MPDDLEIQIGVKEESLSSLNTDSLNDERASNRSHEETFQNLQPLNLKDNNCLMLADTTLDILPSNLRELFKHFQTEPLTVADVCYLLCYLVALETGFAELHVYKACVNDLHSSSIVTSYYDAQNVRNLTQFKPTIQRTDDTLHFSMQLRSLAQENCFEALDLSETDLSILYSAIVTGDFMIVSLTPLQRKRPGDSICARSICLSMPRYVVSIKTPQKTLNDCLRNMDEFSRKLREELFVPVRCHHLQLLDADIYPALDGLPLETYHLILKLLDEKHLSVLAKVSKQFSELVNNRDNFHSTTSSIRNQDLPRVMSSYFEMEPYYQIA